MKEQKKSDHFKTKTSQKSDELRSALRFDEGGIDHFAVIITRVLGSMSFLVVCIITFVLWITWNLKLLSAFKPFDPFPFPILEMTVSIFAIILSVSVLINQNRQGRIEKIKQQVEFEVNVRAEEEITKVLHMLHTIHQKMGLDSKEDQELEKMKEQTDINKIHQTLDGKDKPDL